MTRFSCKASHGWLCRQFARRPDASLGQRPPRSRWKHFLMLSLGLIALASPVRADDKAIDEMKARLDRLEQINQKLLDQNEKQAAKIEQLEEKTKAQPVAVNAADAAPVANEQDVKRIIDNYLRSKDEAQAPEHLLDSDGNDSRDPPANRKSRGVFETSVTKRILGEGTSSTAGWDDGYFIRSADGSNNLRITGQLQTDYRTFFEGPDTKDIDSFYLRRARLGIEADVMDYYEFRILPDFSNNPSSTPAPVRLLDAYMNIHYWDAFQIEVGKFKQPISFEQLILDRYIPTAERSLIDQLVPARDPGAMIHGEFLFDDRLDYAFSVYNGEINGDYDTNNRKDLDGRVVFRPFNGPWCVNGLSRFQIGIGATIGYEQESLSGLTLKTPQTVPFFSFNNLTTVTPTAGPASTAITNVVTADGIRTRVSPELAYFYKGLGVAAQYYHQDQELRMSTVGSLVGNIRQDVPIEGGYVLVTCLLTGETRTAYTQAIEPIRPFDPVGTQRGIGAWELVGRVSRLELGDDVFQPFVVHSGATTATVRFADPTQFSRGATEMTLGFNWYLNRFVRIQCNYEHSWFDQPIHLSSGPAGVFTHDDALTTRFQILF